MPTNPPVGLATKTGLSVTATAFVFALLAYLQGDRSEQTLGVLVSGAIGALSLAITLLGRYWQAASAAKTKPPAQPLMTYMPSGTSNYAMVTSTENPTTAVSGSAARTGSHLPTTADQIDPDKEVPGGGVPAGASEKEAMRALGRKV